MSDSGTGAWTAIILAGQRPGESDFAHGLGFAAKALIPIGGEPMLGRVARALLASPSIGRIVVLAQEPDLLVQGDLAWIAAEPGVALATGRDGISNSILNLAGSALAPWPVLVVTADHALLTPAIVESFLAGASETDAAVAVVERRVVQAAYPETKRTWLKFSDGAFTGANLFALRTPAGRKAAEIWSEIEADRKKARKLLGFFGWALSLRTLTRTISIEAAIRTAAKRGGFSCTAVRLTSANAAIDVDKLEDLRLAERIVAVR